MNQKSIIVLLAGILAAAGISLWCLLPDGENGNTDAASGASMDMAEAGSEAEDTGEASAEMKDTSSLEEAKANLEAAEQQAATAGSGGTQSTQAAVTSGSEPGGGTANQAEQTMTVTLSIDALTIGGGYILPAQSVTALQGDTVFDVLARECVARGIHMEYVNTPVYNSAFIEGIANIYEFDYGELSGWMYSVNGVFPNSGCSQYVLSASDTVQLRYTCDLGKDIGGSGVTQG